MSESEIAAKKAAYRRQITMAGLRLPTPQFVEGQAVLLLDDPEIWFEKVRGHTGVVTNIERSYYTGEPDKWLYTVHVDDVPYSVQCGEYALAESEARG